MEKGAIEILPLLIESPVIIFKFYIFLQERTQNDLRRK